MAGSEQVVSYMRHRRWEVDEKLSRKRYLHRLARQSRQETELSSKIGGMLIYNQVIEQYLTDIVSMSIFYIRAQLWPVEVALDIDLDGATFGKMVDHFQQFATVGANREEILQLLKKHNIKRNAVVHDLFDIQDLQKLSQELDAYAQMGDSLIALLDAYDDEIVQNFRRLAKEKIFA